MPINIKDALNGSNFVGTVNGCSIAKSVPSSAVFTDTNTWRPVVDNLTSTATDQSLSANQGKVLKALVDGKAASSHGTHISDTGWKNFTLASGISLASGGVARYRKINNMVYVEMNVTGVSHAGSGATAVTTTLATLPSGYRPSSYLPIDGTAGASQPNPCRIECNTNGTIRFRSSLNKVKAEYTLHESFNYMI